MTDAEQAALGRLLMLASHIAGPQSAYVANFLLAWANAADHRGFDLTDLWQLDRSVADDVLIVFGLVSRKHVYPHDLGYAAQMDALVALWRDAHADTDHAALAH